MALVISREDSISVPESSPPEVGEKKNFGKSRPFYPELESLRGVAALAVVLLHIVLVVTNDGSGLLGPEALSRMGWDKLLFTQISVIVFNGRAAVVLFFVLSGFVLSIGFDETKRLDGGTYTRFLVRRAFRLFPALWATVVLSVLVGYFLAGQHYSLRSITSYFLLIDLSFAPPTWTLVYEIAVCIIYPFMFFAIRQQTVAMQTVALVGVSWFLRNWPVVIHYGQVQGELPLVAFFLGICTPTVGHEIILRLRHCRGVLAVLAVALIFAPESLRWYADFHHRSYALSTCPQPNFIPNSDAFIFCRGLPSVSQGSRRSLQNDPPWPSGDGLTAFTFCMALCCGQSPHSMDMWTGRSRD
jgi:peptidoglycan/LPS O-acetylase OafA/YrhL